MAQFKIQGLLLFSLFKKKEKKKSYALQAKGQAKS